MVALHENNTIVMLRNNNVKTVKLGKKNIDLSEVS